MKVNSENIDNYSLALPMDEKNKLTKVINYVEIELNTELDIRTGFKLAEYDNLTRTITSSLTDDVTVSKDQLIMIYQILNEVLNGIFIENFEGTFNLTRTEAEVFMKDLGVYI